MRAVRGSGCDEGGGIRESVRVPNSHMQYTILITLPLSSPPQYGDFSGWTALIAAAACGHVDAVKALVAADPDRGHLGVKVSVP